MKKRLLSLILIPMLMTACSSQEPEAEKTDVESVSSSFLEDFEACKNKEYVNLDLSDCGLHLTDFNECRSLDIENVNNAQAAAATAEENMQKFEEYCEALLGEYDPEYALFDSFDSISEYNPIEINGHTYVDYPKISDYYEQIKNGSMVVDWFIYRNTDNGKYLWWGNNSTNFPHWVDKGNAISRVGDSVSVSWIPHDIDPEKKVASYINDGANDDVTYQLLDGEVSIGEAVSYFENDYMKDFPYDFDENWSLSVLSVDVYKLDDELYCYAMYFSPAWRGIPLNHMVSYSTNDASSYFDYCIMSEALMIKKDDVDIVKDFYLPLIISEEEPAEGICSLESAVDIISDKLTKHVVFEVESIEFVYAGIESDDYSSAYLEPCWKMVAYNPNDDWYYAIYLNAVTQKCRYFQYRT